MSTLEKEKHTLHTYERSRDNKDIYRCIDPYCLHYHKASFIEGKAALCPKCGEEFIISKIQIKGRYKRPVCIKCSKSPKAQEQKSLEATIENILNKVNKLEEVKNE